MDEGLLPLTEGTVPFRWLMKREIGSSISRKTGFLAELGAAPLTLTGIVKAVPCCAHRRQDPLQDAMGLSRLDDATVW